MPELAEVESYRSHVEQMLKGRKVVSAKLATDDIVIINRRKAIPLVRLLKGKSLSEAVRYGKHLALRFQDITFLLHFGMTGAIHIRGPKHNYSLYVQKGSKLTEREKFIKLRIAFADGSGLFFDDPRRFGRIEVVKGVADLRVLKNLGWDVLTNPPPLNILKERFARSRKPIKAFLLDQTLFAGVGNWLADDILLEAKIAPDRIATDLDLSEIKNIRRSAIAIVKRAVKVSADDSRFPAHWLFHVRWNDANKFSPHGYELSRAQVAGRTTVWVPALQS